MYVKPHPIQFHFIILKIGFLKPKNHGLRKCAIPGYRAISPSPTNPLQTPALSNPQINTSHRYLFPEAPILRPQIHTCISPSTHTPPRITTVFGTSHLSPAGTMCTAGQQSFIACHTAQKRCTVQRSIRIPHRKGATQRASRFTPYFAKERFRARTSLLGMRQS